MSTIWLFHDILKMTSYAMCLLQFYCEKSVIIKSLKRDKEVEIQLKHLRGTKNNPHTYK